MKGFVKYTPLVGSFHPAAAPSRVGSPEISLAAVFLKWHFLLF